MFGAVVLACGSVLASPPTDPVPTPLYSFDRQSPSVQQPGPIANPDDVLLIDTPNGPPVVAIQAGMLGLGQPNDDLNAISYSKSGLMPTQEFVLLFSVDRNTSGDVPPDPLLFASEAPFNVADQAARGHAAGDAFISLSSFTVMGPVARGLRTSVVSNTQAKNQYDEGGHDFGGKPETSSRDNTTGAIDGVDSFGYEMPVSARGVPLPASLYYSVDPLTPSLATLPGNSAADVFFHIDPTNPGAIPQRFASAANLGLQSTDDIDALVVLDNDDNGMFNVGDVVFLSLAPGSPSLSGPQAIQNISSNGAADVIAARFIAAGTIVLEVFAPAAELGLVGPTDNVDALEIVLCTDPLVCGLGAGIRLVRGDWNNDALVNIADFPDFVPCLAGPGTLPPAVPICLDVFDYDFDGDIDLKDFFDFQEVFTP